MGSALLTFPAVIKCLNKGHLMEKGVSSDSQFRGTVDRDKEVLALGGWGSHSRCSHTHSGSSGDERLCLAPFLLLIQIRT